MHWVRVRQVHSVRHVNLCFEAERLMWLQIGLWGGALLVAVAVVRQLVRRRSSRAIDVGPVSDAWLAEQRGRRQDGL